MFYNNFWTHPIDSRHVSAVAGLPSNDLQRSATIGALRCLASGGLRYRH
jgi:hypothetical protein